MAETGDPSVLALQALAFTLGDAARAARLLAVTGLEPAELRASAGSPAMLAAVLRFLEDHEPDLIAAADALGVAPAALVAARHALERR